jgi:hypothetical protein
MDTTPVATLDCTTKPRIARRWSPSSTRSAAGKRERHQPDEAEEGGRDSGGTTPTIAAVTPY